MTKFVARINMPGYLPEGTTPVFDRITEAWSYLAEERERGEEAAESWEHGHDGLSDDATDVEKMTTLAKLRMMANLTKDDGEHSIMHGSVQGPTPGSDSPHDLGLVYAVDAVSDADAAEIEALDA
jgi:hypothetical protein